MFAVIILGQCISARILPKAAAEYPVSAKQTFSCAIRPDGIYADVLSGCRQFHQCFNGQKQTVGCPSGTLFDSDRKACVLETQHVVCGSVLGKIGLMKATQQYPVGELLGKLGFDCRGRKIGYYADDHSRDCRTFHFCYNGARKTRQCPEGTAFDETETRCSSKRAMLCQKPQETSSGNKRQIKFKRTGQFVELVL